MKKTLCLLFCLYLFFILNTTQAVTAYPYPVEFTQPDGSKITIQLKGDEKIRWAETTDGYSILFNKKGNYEYAILDNNNDMQLSGIQAKNQSSRDQKEILFLNTIPKYIHFSQAQVKMMKSAWNIYSKESQKSFPTVGNRNLICILIGFTDLAFTKTNADFDMLFNQINYTGEGATGSVKDYYLENSYSQLNLNITVAGPYTASQNMAYYGADYGSSHSIRAGELITEAIIAANPAVNFANYDNDNNGSVDGVYVIFAGYGQEAGGSADAIWSHASSIYPSLSLDGKTISKYSCSPELRFNYGDYITRIGVICHEFGHVLGAPDYYDTNYATGGEYDGTGEWDLMAGGSWNNGGKTPAHHNAFTKTAIYNWATANVLSTAAQITLDNAATYSNSFYRYNTTTTNEYYLIENRQKTKFDAYIPAKGMVIYHVDGNYINNAGNAINTTSHQGMYPVCANAAGNPPTTYGTINGTACSFPGTANKTSFTDATTPNSKSWANTNTNKPITNITENVINRTVSFAFMGGNTCSLTTTQASNLNFTATTNSISIGCTRGNGNKLLIIAKEASYVNANLLSGASYTADSVFSLGQEIGTGNFVVYNGNGNTATITGLTFGTTYYFACYEYNTAENCYLTPSLNGNFTTNYNLPSAAGTITGDSSICKGQNNVIYTVAPVANASFYNWTLPSGANGSSQTNSISVNYSSSSVSGDITVCGSNPTANGTPSSLTITVNAIPPTPTITQNGNLLISDAINGNQWYIQTTGPLSTATSSSINPEQTGSYFVIVVENGCQSAPSNSIFYDYNGIEEDAINTLDLKVYPNPFSEKTTINYTLTKDENVELLVVDIMGKEIIKFPIQKQLKGNQSIIINASSLTSGIYFYKIKAGNSVQKGKLILN